MRRRCASGQARSGPVSGGGADAGAGAPASDRARGLTQWHRRRQRRWAFLRRGPQPSHLSAVADASRPADQFVARPAVAALAGHSPGPRALGRHPMEIWHGWSRRVMPRWWVVGGLISPLILVGCITLNIP